MGGGRGDIGHPSGLVTSRQPSWPPRSPNDIGEGLEALAVVDACSVRLPTATRPTRHPAALYPAVSDLARYSAPAPGDSLRICWRSQADKPGA